VVVGLEVVDEVVVSLIVEVEISPVVEVEVSLAVEVVIGSVSISLSSSLYKFSSS